jgi:hypothetical protein
LKSFITKDFLEDINLIKKVVLKNDWNIYILDYSIKECSIKTIRVIIPSISDILRFRFEKINNFEQLMSEELFFKKKDIDKMNFFNKFIFLNLQFYLNYYYHTYLCLQKEMIFLLL